MTTDADATKAALVTPGPTQAAIIAAILNALDDRLKSSFTAGQARAVADAADLVCQAFGGPPKKSTAGAGLVAWLLSGDVGAASLAMARHLGMATRVPGWEHAFDLSSRKGCVRDTPRDAGDLGRCLTLLAAVPGFGPNLHLMAGVSPAWSHAVAKWGLLTTAYETSKEQDRVGHPLQARANRDVISATLLACAEAEDWAEERGGDGAE